MSTLVLQTAGSMIGGIFGPVGAMIGSAVGAMGGYMIDSALIASTKRIEGPRLSGAKPMLAEEGAPLPYIYGSQRASGTLIWATRFQEQKTTERQGAKGGPKVTTYSYYANAAFAIAEGEISCVRRIWADGKELDQTKINMRVYRGSEDQLPDPLLEAKQGADNAPAYRGTAYVVFEHLPIDDFGNRLPLLQFEVIRSVGAVARNLQAVALIPGATEFGLSPYAVTDQPKAGETRALNKSTIRANSDWTASLDELQALCPQLQRVAIIVPWFGTDLRAGQCAIKPGVVSRYVPRTSRTWQVNGQSRKTAHLISDNGNQKAYGGTPSDQSVIDAIKDAKRRGLKVTIYPFLMMDIAAGNQLPSPETGGGIGQPAYPWRGRISCDPVIGAQGSADQTALATQQVEAFLYDTWGYRRFIEHYLSLVQSAGGVDAFLLGSELRGLTQIRNEVGDFPFVTGLCELAELAKSRLGSGCAITYAADWSEYFGYHPQDGSGDVFFHLDPLWAHPAVTAIGIDNYMPLSDWRDGDERSTDSSIAASAYDQAALMANIAGGEGYDWYYASFEDRQNRRRTFISDGQAGKPWVFRYKDLRNWWQNPHYDRVNGQELAQPTAWQPMSKPFWLTELGCAAVDKGTNQPNVFPDPKSSENAVPYFSNGSRCDLAPDRFLRAHFEYWQAANDGNPMSPVYGGRMLDTAHIYLWAWDTRPFPEFPLYANVWGDAANWSTGHWLNGRLSSLALDELIEAMLVDFGLQGLADCSGVEGTLAGYSLDGPISGRAALEPLPDMFTVAAFEAPKSATPSHQGEQAQLVFRRLSRRTDPQMLTDYVQTGDAAGLTLTLEDRTDLPSSVEFYYSDPLRDYQSGSAFARREILSQGKSQGQGNQSLSLSGAMEQGAALALAENWLERLWAEWRSVALTVPWSYAALTVGDRIRLPVTTGVQADDADHRDYTIVSLEDGIARQLKAVALAPVLRRPDRGQIPIHAQPDDGHIDGQVLFHLLDLPLWPGANAQVNLSDQVQSQFRIACYAKPWRGAAVYASPENSDFSARHLVTEAAIIGELLSVLPPADSGRLMHQQSLEIRLYHGELRSQSMVQILNGANTALIETPDGRWEVLQFSHAEERAPDIWHLKGLLRGQLGSEHEAAMVKQAGAGFILLNQAVVPAGLSRMEIGLDLHWRVGSAGQDFSETYYQTRKAQGGLRALLPLSPVHLRKKQIINGDMMLQWIRRGRIDADSWNGLDIPLGEESESYQVEIRTATQLLRTVIVTTPSWIYPADLIEADRSAASGELLAHIAQISPVAGAGARAVIAL